MTLIKLTCLMNFSAKSPTDASDDIDLPFEDIMIHDINLTVAEIDHKIKYQY